MLNNWNGIGRITKSIELKMTQSNIPFCNFTLAVERTFKDANGEKQADFIQLVAFRKTAELMAQYLDKGSLIAVTGRIQTRTYDKDDGTTVYITEVVADSIQFLEPKKSDHPQTDEQIDNTYKHEKTYNVPNKDEEFKSNVDADNEELPF